mmetsp:Transcript_26613/g.79079  ORF Transcript_26613/g.79079 Transcript_26613/m.79079 type:complete len:241 (-) Transcript_26613:565-1287(-)
MRQSNPGGCFCCLSQHRVPHAGSSLHVGRRTILWQCVASPAQVRSKGPGVARRLPTRLLFLHRTCFQDWSNHADFFKVVQQRVGTFATVRQFGKLAAVLCVQVEIRPVAGIQPLSREWDCLLIIYTVCLPLQLHTFATAERFVRMVWSHIPVHELFNAPMPASSQACKLPSVHVSMVVDVDLIRVVTSAGRRCLSFASDAVRRPYRFKPWQQVRMDQLWAVVVRTVANVCAGCSSTAKGV